VAGGAVRRFLTGVGLLGRGLGLCLRNPKLLGLGVLPALIAGVLYAAALVALAVFVDDVARALTGFADHWSTGWRDAIRAFAGAGVVGLAGLLTVLTFTAAALLIGDPFYERISELVEERFGGVPDAVVVARWRSLGRSLVDALRLVGLSVVIAVPLFVAGFLPVIGQTVVPALGAAVAGWMLAVELTGVPFQRRGRRLADRRRVLRRHRPMALGFGVAVFVCFLIPFGAVLLMPAAVAGGTLLSRHALGLAVTDPAG
jgi:CysZ protein